MIIRVFKFFDINKDKKFVIILVYVLKERISWWFNWNVNDVICLYIYLINLMNLLIFKKYNYF